MGITRFFGWFKNQFKQDISKLKKHQTFSDINIEVDNLMIDMNGIIHTSAQKIYEYGNNKPNKRMLNTRRPKKYGLKHQIQLFEDICLAIEQILFVVNPSMRLILCIDGTAPQSKQNQQRQRRFRGAQERSVDDMEKFDSNCITPGTKFMNYLSKYIDVFIRRKISEDERWRNIDVVFSNEKVPGEGEHKLMSFIRSYGQEDESYCIHGLDADLIMLAFSTHVRKFYILRDDLFDFNNDFLCVKMESIIEKMVGKLSWSSENFNFCAETAINDFVFLCFMVGNDFLPHIPSLEIIENGIDLILNVYRDTGRFYGHITEKVDGDIRFNHEALRVFLGTVSQYEKDILEDKLSKKNIYFPEQLLEDCSSFSDGKHELDIDRYRSEYCTAHFPEGENIEKICHEYFKGLQWVISYYTSGVPNWEWQYPYHYVPSAIILSAHITTFSFVTYGRSMPNTPFQQLLSVLPPKSAKLIPKPLDELLTDEESAIRYLCPEEFKVDISGKKNDWEGKVILPAMDSTLLREEYFKKIHLVDLKELKRNIGGKTYVYRRSSHSRGLFKSFYGDINEYFVQTFVIDLD